ncbi:MAG TPA: hypothetical protein VFO03_14365 [Gaiellaceae bacterium]|nr:hypothetical protein [Gaiellaceae bacterium]
MHRLAALLAVLACACAFAGGASGALRVGVSDDFGTNADQSTWFLDHLGELGMTENRISVTFDASNPTTIQQRALLDLYVPLASLRGIRVVFSVSPSRAKGITETPGAVGAYASYVALLAQTYPGVKDFIIGNEPNQPRFWQPQFDTAGENVSASSYFQLLAASYDSLKAVDPSIRVVGLGLSPRGGDRPNAANNVSTSPVRFLNGLGKAFRASRRTRPVMDELAFHPYPDQDRDPLMKGYRWPNAGIPNLDRIKQAVWDAFRGTAQPTFPEGPGSAGLAFRLDEVGWQVGIDRTASGSYHGRESIRPTDEATQAGIYRDALRYLACDASVSSVLFFLLRDEPDLDRWQAGLVRADGTRRPSFEAVKSTLAQTGGRCQGALRSWRHTTRVEGAKVRWPLQRRLPARRLTLAVVANAEEDAQVEAVLLNARGTPVLRRTGFVNAYRSSIVRFSARFRPGRYRLRLTFRAAMNPARTSSFSAPLRTSR